MASRLSAGRLQGRKNLSEKYAKLLESYVTLLGNDEILNSYAELLRAC